MRTLVSTLAVATALMIGGASAQTAVPAPGAKTMTVPPNAALSSNLIGLNLQDGANNAAGEIKDLVFVNNQLAGYILSVGGFLGMGERYVAVTPGTVGLAYNEAEKKWKGTINATKDELKAAPEFKYEGKFGR